MDLNRLPWRNLSRRPLRTAALLVLTFSFPLSFCRIHGSREPSERSGNIGNRLGADIIVVPNTANGK